MSKSYSKPNSFVAKKQSLSYKENIKSWNKGTKRKLIAEPSNVTSKTYRNGLILT